MRRLYDGVSRGIDQRQFFLRRTAPEHKHHGTRKSADGPYDGVGEFLPAVFLMRARGMCADGQDGVEEQDPLFCPLFQRSAFRNRRAEIGVQFLEDVAERWRKFYTRTHRKGEPVRLPVVMIGVLSENQYTDFVRRSQAERAEEVFQGRKNLFLRVFLFQKRGQ